jgi:hypothetical protein
MPPLSTSTTHSSNLKQTTPHQSADFYAILSNENLTDSELGKLYYQILSPPGINEKDQEHLRLILGTIIFCG